MELGGIFSNEKNNESPFINKQISKFRGWGVNGNIELGNNELLDLEDPTYIVFDINIIEENSTLFFPDRPLTNEKGQVKIGKNAEGKRVIIDQNNKEFIIKDSAYKFLLLYSKYDTEINSSSQILDTFIDVCKRIFPFSNASNKETTGGKRHYINSVAGLGVLNKKIINYPEDKITLKLSEDVSMLSQYLSELYLDLTYSFASQRQIIPNNLLRFDMMIIMSDIRDMKLGKIKSNKGLFGGYIDKIVENKSKYLYILHDCEFSFFNSKIHGEDITVGGFNAQPTNTPATLDIDIIFKSYSRILIPALMSNTSLKDGYILDFKYNDYGMYSLDQGNNEYKIKKIGKKTWTEKQAPSTLSLTTLPTKGIGLNTNNIISIPPIIDSYTRTEISYKEIYDKLNDNYLSLYDYSIKGNKKTYNMSGIDDIDSATYTQNYSTNNDSMLGKLGKKALNELKGLGSSLQQKAVSQAGILVNNLQKGVGDMLGVNMSLTKINVYYETPEEKLERLSLFANNIVNKTAQAVQKTASDTMSNVGKSIRGEQVNFGGVGANFSNILPDAANGAMSLLTGKKYSSEDSLESHGNIYSRDINKHFTRSGILYETPSGENSIYNDEDYNDKKPTDKLINLNSNVNNHSKYFGDSGFDNVSGENADVHPDGKYNEKYPSGDVNPDGKYNKKQPNGDLHKTRTYNKKYPTDKLTNLNKNINKGELLKDYVGGENADVHQDGKYNKKYPEGDLHENSRYNEKYPKGDLHENSVYNKKYPEGDLHENSTYNEKYPSGDLHGNSTYNEKYPEGDLHIDGMHNEKYPEGDLHINPTYNEKYPEGDLHTNGQYNIKYPSGDLHENSTYNEKYPEGDLHENSTYNEKYPEGDLQINGKYNEKYPEGDLHENSTYNEKFPEGDLHENSTYNEKYPEGDLHDSSVYNKKYPEGDLHKDGLHNEKYPDGIVQGNGKYNTKYPSGDLHENSTYNEKYPEGDLHKDGVHNEKYPEGDLHKDGKYNEKKPVKENVYGKKSKIRKNDLQYEINFTEDDSVFDRHKDGEYHDKEPEDNNIYLNKNNSIE